MAIKVAKGNLQSNKYAYTWNRDHGDGEYAGILDKIKVDKDEGYEVQYFIQKLMNKYNLVSLTDVHRIENELQSPKLSSMVMRKELEDKIITNLSL